MKSGYPQGPSTRGVSDNPFGGDPLPRTLERRVWALTSSAGTALARRVWVPTPSVGTKAMPSSPRALLRWVWALTPSSRFHEKHIFYLLVLKGKFNTIVYFECFSSIFANFHQTILPSIRMHFIFFIEFQCFSSVFSKQNCITVEKHKNTFFMFPRIKIHGRLTKNHELFWNSCHLLPVSKRFSKSDIYLISLLSGRENH